MTIIVETYGAGGYGDGTYGGRTPSGAATAFADRVLDAMGPAFRDRAGPLLVDLVDALTSQVADTDTALALTDRGWARIFDLDTTPNPQLVGLATGTRVPGAITGEDARAYVRDRPSWRRGTLPSLRAAITAALTGPRQVQITERDGSPWRLTIRVYAGQLLGGTTAALEAAIASQKPVGIVVDLLVDSGASYAHMRTVHGPTYTAQVGAYPTYATAKAHEPEEGTTP